MNTRPYYRLECLQGGQTHGERTPILAQKRTGKWINHDTINESQRLNAHVDIRKYRTECIYSNYRKYWPTIGHNLITFSPFQRRG